MPQFNVQGAIASGYTPEQVVNYLSQQGNTGFDFAGALQAGYAPNEILQEYQQGAPTTSSPLTALANSAGSIVSGVGRLGQQIGQGIQNNAPAWLAKGLGATGGLLNGTDQAIIQAGQDISNLNGPQQYDGKSVQRFGQALRQGNLGGMVNAAAGALASAAPYAAVAAIPAAGPAILGASGAGNTIQARMQAQGESSPSAGDVLAGAGSAALNTVAGPLAHGVLGGLAGKVAAPALASMSSPIARVLARTALGGAAGGAMGAANYGLDTAGTGQGNLQGAGAAALEGAGTGAIMAPVAQGIGGARTALQNARTASQAGPDVQAYQQETAPWTAAVQQARQTILKQNPNLDPNSIDQAAQAQAQQSGVQAPTYDKLSPEAQSGMAQMGLLNLYNQRLAASTTNMGRNASTATPASVFKGVMDDLTQNIQLTGDALQDSGQLTADQNKTLNAAVMEARRNNRNPAQGGAGLGYFDTLRDQVSQLPIDPAAQNTLMLNLQMLDMAQQNSVKGASMGPLERNAGAIGTVAGALSPLAMGMDGHGGSMAQLERNPFTLGYIPLL